MREEWKMTKSNQVILKVETLDIKNAPTSQILVPLIREWPFETTSFLPIIPPLFFGFWEFCFLILNSYFLEASKGGFLFYLSYTT